MSVRMALKIAVEMIGQFSCLVLQSSRIDMLALSPAMLSENMVVFFHLFKEIKEKYMKLFLHHSIYILSSTLFKIALSLNGITLTNLRT